MNIINFLNRLFTHFPDFSSNAGSAEKNAPLSGKTQKVVEIAPSAFKQNSALVQASIPALVEWKFSIAESEKKLKESETALKVLENDVDSLNSFELTTSAHADAIKTQLQSYLKSEEHPGFQARASRALEYLESKQQSFKNDNEVTNESTGKRRMIADPTGLIKMPADGNCLFHAINTLLQLHKGLNHAPSAKDLREQAVELIKNNYKDDETLKYLISRSIGEYNGRLRETCEVEIQTLDRMLCSLSLDPAENDFEHFGQEQYNHRKALAIAKCIGSEIPTGDFDKSVKEYLSRMSKNGEFGSEAEAYVLSAHYDLPINFELSNDVTFQVNQNVNSGPSATIVYHTISHFDVRYQFE